MVDRAPITLTNVTVSYSPAVMGRSFIIDTLRGRKREPFVSLRDVSLRLEHGESLGIVGHNGAGKSTILKVMAGLLPPISGQIDINGRVSSLLELGAGLEGSLDGWTNIDLSASLQRLPKNKIADFKEYVVSFSELGPALDRPVRTYSVGMLLRLIFSMRTYVAPEILVVDEVFGVGDKLFAAKAQKRTSEILRSASCFALASHDVSLLKTFCKRAIWLDGGRLLMEGPTEEVTQSYAAATS